MPLHLRDSSRSNPQHKLPILRDSPQYSRNRRLQMRLEGCPLDAQQASHLSPAHSILPHHRRRQIGLPTKASLQQVTSYPLRNHKLAESPITRD